MKSSLNWNGPSHCGAVAFVMFLTMGLPASAAAEPVTIDGGTFSIVWNGNGDQRMIFDVFDPPLPEEAHARRIWLQGRALPPADGDFDPATSRALEIDWPTWPDPPVADSLVSVSTRVMLDDGWLHYWTEPCCLSPGICCAGVDARGDATFVMTGGLAVLEHRQSEFGGEWLEGSAPFTFTGVIDAFGFRSGEFLFQQQVRGRGTAFIRYESADRFSVRYDIEPIPEPATMVLFGLGAAGLALRSRSRATGR